MKPRPQAVVYWDASAILSVIFEDRHTQAARSWCRRPDVHLMSSLAWTEVQAVVARMARQGELSAPSVDQALRILAAGPWREVQATPDRGLVRPLADRWALRGADLWHLATAKTLAGELPEIGMLTFDLRLGKAAAGEGLATGPANG